ncbi:dihydrodipicolinate synthase family protein [Metabacillus sp. RGM 3146]|uniref:dihydrodipicolinate synthase family protein n=1 Tax=Metabacillus sp. RGM 3146 TaxID=3401092 RepID=UPI003B9B5CCC
MNTEKLEGIFPPISTIVKNGILDKEGMKFLIEDLIEKGVNGFLFLGTGGEFAHMNAEERMDAAEFAVKTVNRRVPCLIGTGSTSTREAVLLSRHAEEIGADGILAVNPYYAKLSEENLFRHYGEIAEAVKIPVLLYNFPDFTGTDLSPDFVLKLVKKYSNIAGIKETTDAAGHIREMILKVKKERPDFKVFCGYDDHLLNTLFLGGAGAIPASANFAPQLTIGIYQSFKKGDFKTAGKLHQKLAALLPLYKLDFPFVNVIKEATRMCGLEVSTEVLPPAYPLSEEKKKKLTDLLKEAELI